MEKGIGHKVEEYSFDEVAKYSYLDSKYTFLLWQVVTPKLIDAEVDKVMDLEMSLLKVLCQMKLTGAAIDVNLLKDLHTKLETEIEQVKTKIYGIAGKVFNLNYNAEKQELLYGPVSEGNRGLKPTILTGKGEKTQPDKRTYSDYSVSAEALEAHPDDELVRAMLEYAEINKLLSTYIIPYIGGEVVKSVNGKEKIEERESLQSSLYH